MGGGGGVERTCPCSCREGYSLKILERVCSPLLYTLRPISNVLLLACRTSIIDGVNAPINVSPVGGGGGGMRARGGDLTVKFIPSVGGLIEYLCSRVGTFDFFDRQTGTKIKRGYMASSFLALKSPVVS